MNENCNNPIYDLPGPVRSVPFTTGHEYLDSFCFVYVMDDAGAISHAWIAPAERVPQVATTGAHVQVTAANAQLNTTATGTQLNVPAGDAQAPVVADAVQRIETAIAAWGRRDATAFDHIKLAPAHTAFAARAREAMCAIPFGKMATYGDLAAEIGNSRASRAVGTACAQNPIPLIVPCHRVIPQRTAQAMQARAKLRVKSASSTDTSRIDVGNYAIGAELKYALLEFEGALE